MNFDNPVAGYYWLQGYHTLRPSNERRWDRPEIVTVVFGRYRNKEQWLVIGFFWRGKLEQYRDLEYRWELIPPMKGEIHAS